MEETTIASAPTLFSKEQMEWLQNMFGKAQICQSSTVASGSIARKGNFLHAFTAKQDLSNVWVIDSGASDHMTRHINLLSNFQPCDKNWTVKVADGSLSRVVGTSSIALSKNIILKSVLLVPNLDCNLLSISKLTSDLDCIAKFSKNVYEF